MTLLRRILWHNGQSHQGRSDMTIPLLYSTDHTRTEVPPQIICPTGIIEISPFPSITVEPSVLEHPCNNHTRRHNETCDQAGGSRQTSVRETWNLRAITLMHTSRHHTDAIFFLRKLASILTTPTDARYKYMPSQPMISIMHTACTGSSPHTGMQILGLFSFQYL